MATGPRLVNKQFNSPIGLYSQQNIQDTLSKQSQVLNNGAVGIDFNNPLSSKPANLANSAVLRMLEEEEQRQRSGQAARYTRGGREQDPNIRRLDRMIDWPPKEAGQAGQINMNNTSYSAKCFDPKSSKGTKRVAWPPPAEENGQDADHEAPAQRQATPVKLYQSPALSRLIPIEPVSHGPPQSRVYSPQPQGSSPQPQAHSPQVQTFPPQFQPGQVYSPQPKFSAPQPKHSSPQPKVLSPQPKVFSPQPAGFGGQSPQPRTPTQTFPPPFPEPYSTFPRKTQSSFAPVSPRGYAPVSSQLYSPVAPSFPPFASAEQPGAFAPAPASRIIPIQFEEPPSTVTLRPIAPVHQRPAPIVASQPAANSFRGGVNMRGDQKWPPQSVKEAVEAENEARISLARGPACRPRKVKKDYTTFFAKNALPNNYPGYKVPPGTQHYDDITGTSQF